MKKIITVLTILALICCLGSLVYAAEGEEIPGLTDEPTSSTEMTTTATEASQTTVASETAAETAPDSGSSPYPEDEPSAEGETPVTELTALIEELKAMVAKEEPQNAAEWVIYKLFGDWAPIVYIVLMAAFSIFLVVLEVKKKIPSQEAFQTKVSNGLTAFTNDSMENSNAFIEDVKEKVNTMKESVTEALTASAKAVELVLELQKEQKASDKDREVLKTILTNETEMLNTIIQASTLAQWRKDEIGELHKKNLLAISAMTETETTKPDTNTTEGGEGV